MTARQIVMQFGLDNVSNAVRGAQDNANYEAWFDVVHLTEPNIDRVNGKELNSRNRHSSWCISSCPETVTSSFVRLV
ncbi:portal protein [Klebsiella pneumoniae]|uniref:portal protein n=1 Tax=Klebsiella pneumoniae TaxID=573 RepID=UPI003F8C5195